MSCTEILMNSLGQLYMSILLLQDAVVSHLQVQSKREIERLEAMRAHVEYLGGASLIERLSRHDTTTPIPPHRTSGLSLEQ